MLDSSLNSNLSNYQPAEVESTKRHLEALRQAAESPELVMANFSRFVRFQDISRFLIMHDVFKEILPLHGSIIELGVLNGANIFSLGKLCEIYEPRNYTRRIYGFDTFDGYADMEAEVEGGFDEASYVKTETVGFEFLKQSVADFNQSIQFNQFEKMHLVKGDASKTIPKFVDEHPELVVSLLLCQTDIYKPTADTLRAILPRMPKGGIILFSAVNDPVSPGETRALDEVLGLENCRLHRFSYSTKACYLVKE